MGKHYSQEMKLEAVKLFEAGKTHREIAKHPVAKRRESWAPR